ncbi:MAG: glycoside hydrolase family 3 C-terminal domain-containing protein [Candidatus Aminicenantes bacterium]|nr:glycoside hydrolase family 3 C-terminal domain-containing protein [Candidatus Aminicenantes bacterium]
MRVILTFLGILGILLPCPGQVYRDPKAPVEDRVKDLLGRMTPEEKFRQLFMVPGSLDLGAENLKSGIFGLQVGVAGTEPAIETARRVNEIQRFFKEQSRLGIPIIPFEEALHGLVQPGATAFPQAIALAATFDSALMGRVAAAIARETKTRGIRQVLSPVVNIADDVRWGRTEETYGEDPYLSAEMGAAFVSEFEKAGVITTPKHLLANVGAGGRDSYPIHWNERLLRELYLPPFEACLLRGGSRSVMTSYNSLDGRSASAQEWLLNRLLKTEWGFKGFVISDAAAVGGANVLHFTAGNCAEAAVRAIAAGLDVIFQTQLDQEKLFSPPFYDGRIDAATIDRAVTRVLRKKFELGLFDDPFVDPGEAERWNGHPSHRALALRAARESIVLLKNEGRVLPLRRGLKSIAVLGPDAAEARLGGYSGLGNDKISILDGIRNKIGKTAEVRYGKGCDREDVKYVPIPPEALSCVVDGRRESGLRGEYFDNVTLSGPPVLIRIDPQIKFQWTLVSPDPEKIPADFYSVRWTGRVKAPVSGKFNIGIDGNDGYRLFLDGRILIDNPIKRSHRTLTSGVELEEGHVYDLRLEYFEPEGNSFFTLVWDVGVPRDGDRAMDEAVRAAAQSEAAVIVAGLEEGEFRDRAYLGLPGRQEELIRKVAATGRPTIVVLVGGSAVTMNAWIDVVPGILDAWYPGEAGGTAVADVLFGNYNPAGRLPVTFPVFEGQLPLVYNHKPTGRGDDYVNLTGRPLFPFGYGLSYTDFAYGALAVEKKKISAGETTAVTFRVTNAGDTVGEEVVQLYIRDELASVARPVKELKGFRRIFLRPGETKDIRFEIRPEMLSMLDLNLKKTIEPGNFRLMIGASSADIRLRGILTVR